METQKILGQGLEIPDSRNQTRWIKAIILGILSVAAFALTWYLLDIGLYQHKGLLFWIWPALSAAFAVSFLAFSSIVDINKWLFWGVNFAILISYLLILPKDLFVMLGGVVFFLFTWLFERHIRDDEHSRADFSIHRVVRSSITLMIYALLIVLGVNIYGLIKTNFEKNPDVVYNQIGRYAAGGLAYAPSGLGIDPNQSFDDFVAKQAESQQPEIAQAPKSVQEQLIEEFRNQLESKFHIQVTGNPLLGEVVAGAVAEKLKAASSSYSNFFPAIFALLVVILLRYTAFLFVWLTSFICWLLFKILLSVNFFRIEKVKVEVDKLQI